MDFIGQKILNETDLLKNDQPHFFKNFLTNTQEIVTWDAIEDCVNRPEIFNFELIDKDTNMKIDIPYHNKTWIWDRTVQDKLFVFDKFYRVAREDSKDIEGFGIGLSYVKRVCEWHKWKVEANNNEEKGITITIQINKNDYE